LRSFPNCASKREQLKQVKKTEQTARFSILKVLDCLVGWVK
jgi:hypothetical protein